MKTLEDIVFYDNYFAQGATQSHYTSFIAKTDAQRNERSAIGAAINAVGASVGLDGFADLSNGATAWDGLDLIFSKYPNSHRSYTWSEDSKDLIKQYKDDNKGDVDVSKWTYATQAYEASATAIVGRTLDQRIHTARGEGKQSKKRFK